MGLFLGSLYCSNDLSNVLNPVPCCFGYISLLCVLKSLIVMSPVLFFHFFLIFFDFFGLLCAPIYILGSPPKLSESVKNFIDVLMEGTLNL